MLKIGQFNLLKVDHKVDFGVYLDSTDGREILMPAKFIENELEPGDEVNVFVYTDSEDRLIATTEHPFATVGEFAFLQVAEVNKIGAFLDWGIQAKHLLVPFSEQKEKMLSGGVYLVYVYLDDTTKRVVASSKIEKFVGNVIPNYKKGQEVSVLPFKHTEIGYKCIVDNLHFGMIYSNETYHPIELEVPITAFVKQVREDGKIDLTVADKAKTRTRDLATEIMDALDESNGVLPFSDSSSPEDIKKRFACSKKDFKKALGSLYKSHMIEIKDTEIVSTHRK